ncbi:carboxymuconolactone decarboxylase family protein [Sphaerisporangium rubeum]|uniref:AhpD family alkylhydroperoxidase n=1 Tax=Sphaerisporangium rubeum TaxID=321317 RepID=A0A7X0M4G4_9ACTN|nr:carboxymuconolactone decarboxylase family protein [Sphaerisporangium rubeum]MBB6471107.1 AhpD family alkylhydroperoxidase [Sphaerisporangium rubeum]
MSTATTGEVAETARVKLDRATPEIYKAMRQLNAAVETSGLEHSLLELVKTRASQINGCAFCLDMHTIDARAAGETEQRLYTLPAWRETPFFTPRERAALEVTEAVTLIANGGLPDDVYARATEHFTEDELAKLLWAVTVINAWNRIAVSTRMEPGHYTARHR